MSTPRYFRLAIESCRPCRPATLRLRPEFHARHFASKNAPDQQDVTQGSPVPPVAKSVAESPSEESQLLSDLPDAPPKRNPISVAKALSKTQQPASRTGIATTGDSKPSPLSRPPLNVLAAYHKPIKHRAEYGVPSCDLQLRSYSIRNLEFMGDFALRAAYYLKLPAVGPVPLPKRIERWTMPRSNFVNKKSQENFERITYKRLIQIKDGHRDAVEVWLSFLRRYQFYGVGMKANIWEYECLDVATKMDTQMHEIQKDLDEKLGMFGWNKQVAGKSSLADMMQKQGPRQVGVPLTMIREESQTRNNKQ